MMSEYGQRLRNQLVVGRKKGCADDRSPDTGIYYDLAITAALGWLGGRGSLTPPARRAGGRLYA